MKTTCRLEESPVDEGLNRFQTYCVIFCFIFICILLDEPRARSFHGSRQTASSLHRQAGAVAAGANGRKKDNACCRRHHRSREEPAGEKKSCRRSEQLMTCRLKPCGSPMKPSGRNRTAFPFSCSCLMIEPAGDTRVPCWRKNPKDEPAVKSREEPAGEKKSKSWLNWG